MTNKTILLNNYIFDYVEDLIPEGDSEGNIATYSPQCLYDNKKHLPLLAEAENNAKFCRFRLHNAFERSGVYVWIVDGKPIYIGETRNFRTRFNSGYGNISPRNCYKGGQKANVKMNKVVLDYWMRGQSIELYFLMTNDYKKIELELIESYHPLYNEKNNKS